jgi:outer membrane lipopolysaccharide assembly protein LptE/RlpB
VSHRATELGNGFCFPKTLCISLCLCVSVAILLCGCGYHVAGRGSRLPATVKTIAVPALENKTSRYRIEQRLTQAVVREFLARTTYHIVPDPANADAVLRGEVSSIESTAVLFDTTTNRATALLVTVRLKVRLEERETKNVLYRNDNFLFRETYEISTPGKPPAGDVNSFFEEQDPALDRLAHDFASKLVAAILENF